MKKDMVLGRNDYAVQGPDESTMIVQASVTCIAGQVCSSST